MAERHAPADPAWDGLVERVYPLLLPIHANTLAAERHADAA